MTDQFHCSLEINRWQIGQGGLSGNEAREWMETERPEPVQQVLINNGRLPDPCYKTNDLAAAWAEKSEWTYRARLELTEQMCLAPYLELVFEGIDTYADIYLNGKLLGSCDNMFVSWRFDVTGKLMPGNNDLMAVFPVMGQKAAEKRLPEGFWTNYSTERAYARKAAYSFGWDWAPRIASVGLFRPVHLDSYQTGRLREVRIDTSDIRIEEKKAVLLFEVDSELFTERNEASGEHAVQYLLTVSGENGCRYRKVYGERCFKLEMDEVEFWWTHDLGTPYLYRIELSMLVDGETVDSYACSYGIRSLEVITRAMDGEARFLFCLNGIPLMARGANWVPVDGILGKAGEDARYIRLLEMAKEANMNMLCLWGGGIYEKELFYELCDRKGILVWQYFMFACGEYPDYDQDFLENVKREIAEAVIRLRVHPCIALWAGNVELTMLCEKIGLQREYYGKRLFEELIPAWLKELDQSRMYLPSSPFSESGPANSMESGDRHNWDIWFTDVPYTAYKEDTARFVSEFGLHGAPAACTVKKYTGEENLRTDSFSFGYFNRDQSLERMYYYMEQHTGVPENAEQYIDYSMLVQAEGLAYAVQHYRSNFPATAGALIWQLNDSAPCHSWSLIDYDLIPKASWYYAKRFFAPVQIFLEAESPVSTVLWVVNQSRDAYEDTVKLRVCDYLGNLYHQEEIQVQAEPGSTKRCRALQTGGRYYPNVIIPNRHRLFYVAAESEAGGQKAWRFFGEYKETLLPDAKLTVRAAEGGIRIRSDVFARFVRIDGALEGVRLSDNYFNLEAGEEKYIRIETDKKSPVLSVKPLNGSAVPVNL